MVKRGNCKKREASKTYILLEELQECISDGYDLQKEIEGKELTLCINRFLRSVSDFERNIFICRYWHMESIKEIAGYAGASGSKEKYILFRTRKKLRKYLRQEGYCVEK